MEKIFVYSAVFMIVDLLTKTQGNGCRSLTFLDCMKNKTFTNHTIESFQVLSPGLELCQHYCFLNELCVSYNMGPEEGKERICELSDNDHVAYPGHLITKVGYEYCPIKNLCSSNPCRLGSTCRPDFDMDSYNCTESLKIDRRKDKTVSRKDIEVLNGTDK
ncbi:uncharacterized protein LOC116286578 [Actinia tenebrosa]|uniref:Uncharacterized protein LOC116286578 n=1 Tax=Actinia tenebrosa TaxID=6105 RepID=A0A6P8GXJ7_ACTTE|nr:uncharacterized protein LOC116286578 [Actinia tenebrosa]